MRPRARPRVASMRTFTGPLCGVVGTTWNSTIFTPAAGTTIEVRNGAQTRSVQNEPIQCRGSPAAASSSVGARDAADDQPVLDRARDRARQVGTRPRRERERRAAAARHVERDLALLRLLDVPRTPRIVLGDPRGGGGGARERGSRLVAVPGIASPFARSTGSSRPARAGSRRPAVAPDRKLAPPQRRRRASPAPDRARRSPDTREPRDDLLVDRDDARIVAQLGCGVRLTAERAEIARRVDERVGVSGIGVAPAPERRVLVAAQAREQRGVGVARRDRRERGDRLGAQPSLARLAS